jgi:hypothetical protein
MAADLDPYTISAYKQRKKAKKKAKAKSNAKRSAPAKRRR